MPASHKIEVPNNYFTFLRAAPAYSAPIRGFLYYHVPYPRQFLSGGIRFRCCTNPIATSFAHGYDLPDHAGLPWDISLPRLLATARHAVFLRQLVQDGLLTVEQIAAAQKLLGGNHIRDKTPSTLIHEIAQPFFIDLSTPTKVCALGPQSVVRAYIYPRVAHCGSALVRLERTVNEGELRLRVLRPLAACEYLPPFSHLPPLAARALLGDPYGEGPWTWTYDDEHPARSAVLHCLFNPTYHFPRTADD
ncbi:hypothetical protein DFH09DRAFT_969196 [Mycena vulgaris]|nr:hypothetical protein DFH09DRAFT_969196 [Mycena vulgaris]